jgi:hypothetical protein
MIDRQLGIRSRCGERFEAGEVSGTAKCCFDGSQNQDQQTKGKHRKDILEGQNVDHPIVRPTAGRINEEITDGLPELGRKRGMPHVGIDNIFKPRSKIGGVTHKSRLFDGGMDQPQRFDQFRLNLGVAHQLAAQLAASSNQSLFKNQPTSTSIQHEEWEEWVSQASQAAEQHQCNLSETTYLQNATDGGGHRGNVDVARPRGVERNNTEKMLMDQQPNENNPVTVQQRDIAKKLWAMKTTTSQHHRTSRNEKKREKKREKWKKKKRKKREKTYLKTKH